MSIKTRTIDTLLRAWDGHGYDNGDVMRDTVGALLSAAYDSAVIETLSPQNAQHEASEYAQAESLLFENRTKDWSEPPSLADQGRAVIAEADAEIARGNLKPEDAYKAASAEKES